MHQHRPKTRKFQQEKMKRNNVGSFTIYFLLLSSLAVHSSAVTRETEVDDNQRMLSFFDGLNNHDNDAIITPVLDTGLAVQQNLESGSKATISSIFPPVNSLVNVGTGDGLTLSFNVQGSGIKRVKILLELNGVGSNSFVIRGAKPTYSLSFRDLPSGEYSWSADVITNNSNKDLRKQSFGPWAFSVQVGDSSTMAPTQSPDSTTQPAVDTLPEKTITEPPAPTPTPVPATQITAGLQNDCLTVDSTKFNICLDLKSPSGGYEPWMEDFGAAKRRWEGILMDDGEKAINLDPYWRYNRELIATSLPPLIDDIYISGFLQPYDGKGGVLGMAGPYFTKTDSKGYRRPVAGYMVFDSDDESWLRRDGIWTNTIIHEMGHVLGLGTLWKHNALHSGSITDDMYRASSQAQAAWEEICPGGRLPVETADAALGIGAGTAGGHWDEQCVVNELMTGFVNKQMPLSKLTVASLADMGYTVDFSHAEPFGRNDLGDCANYCPTGRRNLRGIKPESRPKRKVSARGHLQILRAAAREMGKIRSITPPSLPEGMEYFAGEFMTVYIMDDDGDIKEETVSWAEAKEYAPDAINV